MEGGYSYPQLGPTIDCSPKKVYPSPSIIPFCGLGPMHERSQSKIVSLRNVSWTLYNGDNICRGRIAPPLYTKSHATIRDEKNTLPEVFLVYLWSCIYAQWGCKSY